MGCRICKSSYTFGSLVLTDGSFVHSKCMHKIEHKLADIKNHKMKLEAQITSLENSINSYYKISSKLKRVVSRHPKDIFFLKNKLEIANKLAGKINKHELVLGATIEKIYDFWPTYPPDWEYRRQRLEESNGVCAVCGGSIHLDVHHIKPLSKGGTNRLDNLQLLCRLCHEKKHGFRFRENQRNKKRRKTDFEKKLEIINFAMEGNKKVEFLYKKREDNKYRQRTITPHEIVRVSYSDGSGFTLCVRGFCHLRSSDRHFAMDDRMKRLKIRGTS